MFIGSESWIILSRGPGGAVARANMSLPAGIPKSSKGLKITCKTATFGWFCCGCQFSSHVLATKKKPPRLAERLSVSRGFMLSGKACLRRLLFAAHAKQARSKLARLGRERNSYQLERL